MIRITTLLVTTAVSASLAGAQIVVESSFDPSQSGGLCGLGVDPTTGDIWVFPCFGATIDGYSATGTFLTAIARPGGSADDVDIEFAPEEMILHETTIPEGTLLFINGESGVVEIYAVDKGTGEVLDTLVTAFGTSHVVGGGYDPLRDTFFLVQDRVPGNPQGNRVAEVDPLTGAVLNSFPIGSDFDVNYGDLDVSTVTGHLFAVSSIEPSLGEFLPTGEFVTTHDLPAGVAGLSGIGLACGLQEAWVAANSGNVWQLGGVPCGSSSTGFEEDAGSRFALQPNFPDPFTSHTSIRFTLPRAALARLDVYDLRGRRVRSLVDGVLPAGAHSAEWNGADQSGRPLPGGVYHYHLTAGGVTVTQKAVLLR